MDPPLLRLDDLDEVQKDVLRIVNTGYLAALPMGMAAMGTLVTIARTTKGKGVPYMENRLEWHYRSPTPDELHQALEALEGA